jgi:hypothetical protein
VYSDFGINPASSLSRPKPQIDNTTTLVYPQVPPKSDETSAMGQLLDLEWTVVDEVDTALASAGSPDPSPPAPPAPPARRSDTTRARANPTQRPPRGRPRKFHRPGQRLRPGPSSSPRPDRHRGRRPLRRGGARWMNGGQPLRTRLPRSEYLCWRCGVPGHSRGDCRAPSVLFCSRCGTMGLMSRECPCPRPPRFF